MSNSKISALTSATTPLAGTETLPIVQSSTTKQVSVANLTAGRTPSVAGLTVSSSPIDGQSATYGGTDSVALSLKGRTSTFGTHALGQMTIQSSPATYYEGAVVVAVSNNINVNDPTEVGRFTADGNYVPKTAAKGINFTANTPAAGMTSQLLNWYEEGTWTPNQGAGLTLVGAFSSTGRYTRIGRQVSISGTVTGATSVAVTAAGVITSNLPFTVVTAGHGSATNVAINASATVICTSTSVTAAGAIAATATITFSATYFV
jgi:hypothetical protein